MGPSEHAARAVRRLASREARHVRLSELAAEAMADPDFVADLNETMLAFRHVDQDHWPEYDPEPGMGSDETPPAIA